MKNLFQISEKTLPTAFQERYRFVLDEPDEGGTRCPEIKESRPCSSLPRCIAYKWQLSPWAQCLFPDRFQKCGQGYRARGKSVIDFSVWLSIGMRHINGSCSFIQKLHKLQCNRMKLIYTSIYSL